MGRKTLYKLFSGQELDISITKSPQDLGTVLIYPGIGLTTRMYDIPYMEIAETGLNIIEYHPPAHGRSKGQMTMKNALLGLEQFTKEHEIAQPVFALGHSAGANALLQYYRNHSKPAKLMLVQPVFSFLDSASYMYNSGRKDEFLQAISKWVSEPKTLAYLLKDSSWLDSAVWKQRQLKREIDAISIGIKLGDFLEDFYIKNNETEYLLGEINVDKIFISTSDNWYPTNAIESAAVKYGVKSQIITESKDHFFRNGWQCVWKSFLDSCRS